jgi:signal peptidase I
VRPRITLVLAALSGASALLLLLRRALLVVSVDGASMMPTYQPGDRLLTVRARRGVPIRSGDVVVCRRPDRRPDAPYLVKRVLATAGQPIPDQPAADNPEFALVPPGSIWVQGDSPGYDSRAFGPLPLSEIIGQVLAPLWRTRPSGSSLPASAHPE